MDPVSLKESAPYIYVSSANVTKIPWSRVFFLARLEERQSDAYL